MRKLYAVRLYPDEIERIKQAGSQFNINDADIVRALLFPALDQAIRSGHLPPVPPRRRVERSLDTLHQQAA